MTEVKISEIIQDSNLKEVSDLCRKLVGKKDTGFPLVFLLMKLLDFGQQLRLERAFSAVKFSKSDLGNRIGDGFLFHRLTTYVKTYVFQSIVSMLLCIHIKIFMIRSEGYYSNYV